MIDCPNCKSDMGVLETRKGDDGGIPYIRRRRRCAKCEKRVSTIELIVDDHVLAKGMQLVPRDFIEDTLRQLALIVAYRIGETRVVEMLDHYLTSQSAKD